MKLISMTAFVFLMRENKDKDNIRRFWACEKYANFLKQPLELWMFVPCDKEGNVLEEPLNYKHWQRKALNISYCSDLIKYDEYQQAKERCLFDGFEYISKSKSNNYTKIRWDNNREFLLVSFEKQTVEFFTTHGIKLTQTAIKQIGL